jgi:hypothetical protein
MGIEYLFNKVLHIDMTGFTKHQVKMMSQYDELLIELGEKSYSSLTRDLPVEIRLVGFVLINACIFYLLKYITDNGHDEFALIIRALTGQSPIEDKSSKKKKRMRGPSMSPEDIRRMRKED